MRKGWICLTAAMLSVLISGGCQHPEITAVNLDPSVKEREGIPYYLPKPYLVVSKNIRYIPTPTVGLTQLVPIPSGFDTGAGGFPTPPPAPAAASGSKPAGDEPKKDDPKKDDGNGSGKKTATTSEPEAGRQSEGGLFLAAEGATEPTTGGTGAKDKPPPSSAGNKDAKDGGAAASVYGNQVLGPPSIAVVPAASIPDGLVPQVFYTYQVLYLPDLTQKYGLRIRGGAGEFRATENLVNGWMHTGPGPLYMRDSFTAQTIAATGQTVGEVSRAIGQIAITAAGVPVGAGGGGGKAKAEQTGAAKPSEIPDYAEIFVFEPVLESAGGKKSVRWRIIEGFPQRFKREWIELERAASARSDGGGVDQRDMRGGVSEAEAAVRSGLAPRWDVVDLVVTVTANAMEITVSAKPKSGIRATADGLKTDAFNAGKAYVTEKHLPIQDAAITVRPNISE